MCAHVRALYVHVVVCEELSKPILLYDHVSSLYYKLLVYKSRHFPPILGLKAMLQITGNTIYSSNRAMMIDHREGLTTVQASKLLALQYSN